MNKTRLVVFPNGDCELYVKDRLLCAGNLETDKRMEKMIDRYFVDKRTNGMVQSLRIDQSKN